jgi:cytochrome c biogenesis protein CcdA/glutaredoxin
VSVRLLRWLGALVLGTAAVLGAPAAVAAESQDVELLLFWGDGCPHCAAEKEWLAGIQQEYPDLVVTAYEVWYDEGNRQLFTEVAADHGIEPQGVPTTFLGDLAWVGFNDAIAGEIEAAISARVAGQEPVATQQALVDVPFIGQVDLGDSSLVVSTLVIGFVDGVNPCSLWVLTMLLALVLHSGSRRRVMAVGGTFLLVTSLMYGLYILGFFSVLSYVGYVGWIQRAVAVLVAVLGLLQVKDYVRFHQGPSLGIGDEAKPGLFRRMRGLAAQDRPLPAVLVATTGLAVGVSLLETPCTVGLPMIWTNLVAQQDVGAAGAAVLFVLYMTVFLLDELIVFGVAVSTLRAAKLQERHGRELKLVSGVVMLTLAAVMLVVPEVMESVLGALVVFVVAAVVVAVVLGVGRLRERATPERAPAPPRR